MSGWRNIILGVAAGAAAGLVVLLAVIALVGGDDEGATEEEPAPAGVSGAVEPAGPPGGDAQRVPAKAAGPAVRMQPVTIYQRAASQELRLVGVPAQIVWLDSPVERARQIVRLALEGVGRQDVEAYPPAGGRVAYREVFIDDRGIAWIDLDPASVHEIQGTDEEQSVVAVLARSLVEGLDEVQRVGILVDGESRRTLVGHVDLERTFTGTGWPVIDGGGSR